MDVHAALKGQYHAALAMLRQAIERCPDPQWNGGPHPVPFWRVAYHTLYFTHLYLQQREELFRPWESHREEYHDLPWPPGSGKVIDEPYTKAELLDYWWMVIGRVDADVDALDLEAAESGFSWHRAMPKFEHQLHNIRHIQHHTAMLASRLQSTGGAELDWVRTGAGESARAP